MPNFTISDVLDIRAQLLARHQALQPKQAVAPGSEIVGPTQAGPAVPAPTFVDTLKAAVAKVNEAGEQEDVAKEAYERGELTNVATVAVLQARAGVMFEATMQVRNKLLSAYRDIMNMPLG